MMTPNDVNRYIGLRWESGARGPDAYDCWGLLQHLQREFFGRDLPELSATPGATRADYHTRLTTGEWECVDVPAHGDGALLRGGDFPHVGVWLDIERGGVLHSQHGIGVIWTPRSALRLAGYSRVKYHRFHVRDLHS